MLPRTIALALLCPILITVTCSEQSPDGGSGADSASDTAQCEDPITVEEGCREAACEATDCGSPTSFVDEHLCMRTRCERQEDCLPEEECHELQYQLPGCGYLDPGSKECTCGYVLMSYHGWFCMPRQSP
jgi:hypothetical protein